MSNSREKKPADKKSIQFSCRNTEGQQWWHLGTHTHNLSMNILKSLSITPHHNIQLKLAKLKVFLLSSDRREWGGHA